MCTLFLAFIKIICLLQIVKKVCLILSFLLLIKTNAQLVDHSCLHKTVCVLDVYYIYIELIMVIMQK